MIQAFIFAFWTGFSLILAIGAQNAFVLRQGLRGAHVLPVVLTCAFSDADLIAAGVVGMGWIATSVPWIVPVMRWGGAAFLLVYGALAFRSAWQGGGALEASGENGGSLGAALATCLALTWLNPHVYLDTMVLLGSLSAQFPGHGVAFAAGGMTASFVFFFSLGFGAVLLRPVFTSPRAWRLLDTGVGVLMWVIALGLILG